MRKLLCMAILVLCAGCADKKKPAEKPAEKNNKAAAKGTPGPGQVALPGPFALKRSIEQDMRRQNKKAYQRNKILNDMTKQK